MSLWTQPKSSLDKNSISRHGPSLGVPENRDFGGAPPSTSPASTANPDVDAVPCHLERGESHSARTLKTSLLKIGCLLLIALHSLTGAAQTEKPASAAKPAAFNVRAPALVSEPFDWLNTDGAKLEFQRGQVYVVQFWTFGCINCLRNLPAYARWQKKFEGKNVTLIGVHTPETDAERQRENVVRRVEKLGITYPVLLDQQMTNWKRWQQQVWPTVYLVDKHGRARFRWTGELAWMGATGEEQMAACIEQLLRDP